MVAVEAVADSEEEAVTEVAVVALVVEVETEVEEVVVVEEVVTEVVVEDVEGEEEVEVALELKELKSSLNPMRDSQEFSFLEAKMISLLH